MEQSRNGGGRVVAFEDAMMIGRHRTGSRSPYIVDASRVARLLQQPQGAASRRRTYADGELDVFTAERYFKGPMDGDRGKEYGVVPVPAPAPLEMAATLRLAGTRASAASVSASSATSANSRTVLLRGRRDHRSNKCCFRVGELVRSCSGKRSVRVDTGAADSKTVPASSGEQLAASKIDWYKELRMQKAALGVDRDRGLVAAAAALPTNLNLGTAKVADIGRQDKPAELTSSSSSRGRSFTLVAPVTRGANVIANGGNEHKEDDDDGTGSESSSDLFEIKSLMIDDYPYAPSEVSVQWSVATAPVDDVSASHPGRDEGRGPVAGTGRQSHRDRPAALLSACVSHRAVEVSAAAMRPVPNAPRRLMM